MYLIDKLQNLNIIELRRQFAVMSRRVTRLEKRMGQLRDFVDAVNAETTRLGTDVTEVARKLDAAIASGDPQALADLGTAVGNLHSVGESLHAMATGGQQDPLPTPTDDGSAAPA
jgi:N-acetylglucosamine kinase-like BadF-type ATPase